MIKTTVLISAACTLFLLASCRAFKPAASASPTESGRPDRNSDRLHASGVSGTGRVYKVSGNTAGNQSIAPDHAPLPITGNIETSNDLQFKYAVALNVMVEVLGNMHLLLYMEEWCGTHYRYGGNSKDGIDCSAFAAGLLAGVYQVALPRTVREQYQQSQRIEPYDLQEGDLVFFNTRGPLTHVGVYLMNNKFVHASVSGGVMISDLGEAYFSKRYAGAGRVSR